MRYPAHSVE